MKKILMLTDFSEASRNALEFARSFFRDTLVDFHLFSVFSAESNGVNGLQSNEIMPRRTCDNQLLAIMTELHQQATTDWHTFRSSAESGRPLETVEQAIEAEVYDFVVIGPQPNGTDELFSNGAIALVHRLKANVLVVPPDAQGRLIYQIVLAADFANLKNAKLLGPLKDLVMLKGASLTLLTIDTPEKDPIHPEQEIHLRQFLHPVKPLVARLKAAGAKEGIDAFLAEHPVDLLVTIPRHHLVFNSITDHSVNNPQAYTPALPLLTLYDDGSNDLPQLIDPSLATALVPLTAN